MWIHLHVALIFIEYVIMIIIKFKNCITRHNQIIDGFNISPEFYFYKKWLRVWPKIWKNRNLKSLFFNNFFFFFVELTRFSILVRHPNRFRASFKRFTFFPFSFPFISCLRNSFFFSKSFWYFAKVRSVSIRYY